MILASNFSVTRQAEFFINFSLNFFEEESFAIASASFSEFSGSTKSPVFSFLIISGMPPVRDAITGKPDANASKITMPKASRRDGRIKMSELFIKCGMFFLLPRRVTLFSSSFFWINFSSFSLCGPSPAITNFICLFLKFFAIVWRRISKPFRGWSSATVRAVMVFFPSVFKMFFLNESTCDFHHVRSIPL